jgi:hypothetical protein
MYSVSSRTNIELYNWGTHNSEGVLPFGVSQVQITSDSRFVFASVATGIRKYSTEGQHIMASINGDLNFPVLTPDDKYLIVVEDRDLEVAVFILSTEDLSIYREYIMDEGYRPLSVSADSRTVYCGDSNDVVALDIENGSTIRHNHVYYVDTCKLNSRVLWMNDDDSITVQDGDHTITKFCDVHQPRMLYDGSAIVGGNGKDVAVFDTTLKEINRIPIGERYTQLLVLPVSAEVLIRTYTRVIIVNTITDSIAEIVNMKSIGIASSGPFLGNILL